MVSGIGPSNRPEVVQTTMLTMKALQPILLLPFIISMLPWAFVPSLLAGTSERIEGAMLVAGLVGALSFVTTGPLTAAIVSVARRDGAVTARDQAAVFALVSIPTLCFQVFESSVSTVAAMLSIGLQITWTRSMAPLEEMTCAIIATACYTLYFVAIFMLARKSSRNAIVGSVLLWLFSCGACLLFIVRA